MKNQSTRKVQRHISISARHERRLCVRSFPSLCSHSPPAWPSAQAVDDCLTLLSTVRSHVLVLSARRSPCPRWRCAASLQAYRCSALCGFEDQGLSGPRRPTAGSRDLCRTPPLKTLTPHRQLLVAHLQPADPAVFDIIENVGPSRSGNKRPLAANGNVKEKKRQKHFINLIPSENFTSQAVLDALGSVMQSKPADDQLPFNRPDQGHDRQVLRGLSRRPLLRRQRVH